MLFMTGSACFVVGSVPAYVAAVGTPADGTTFVIGAVFFTSASFAQLLQAQTPGMTEVGVHDQHRPTPVRWWDWRPRDRAWMAAATQFPGTLCFNVSTIAALATYSSAHAEDVAVWRADIFGSTFFLVSSGYGVLALGREPIRAQVRTVAGRIAWINLLGSVLFMVSAVGSLVLPSGDALDAGAAVGGTLLGAVCFFVAAALMFPAWQRAVRLHPTGGEPS